MRKVFTLIAFMVCTYLLQAQTTFSIPDANFFNAILQAQPSCSTCVVNYTTREIDIACLDSKNITSLDVSSKNISNLQGIQYFVDLQGLYCYSNQLISLPALPNSLQGFYCYSNQLTSLPALPNSLTNLNCSSNQITSFSTNLPSSLEELSCYNNQLMSLPALPNSLMYLYASNNQISNLLPLSNTILELDISYNPIDSLPIIPNSLQYLNIGNTNISCLLNYTNYITAASSGLPICSPAIYIPDVHFKNELIAQGIDTNNDGKIQELEALVPTQLSIYGNSNVTNLTGLEYFSNLKYFECSATSIANIPLLPDSLITLWCENNPNLQNISSLPIGLKNLFCTNTFIQNLPNLPSGLQYLDCSYNFNLRNLPSLPNSLQYLNCRNCGHPNFQTFPTLPYSLTSLYCNDNNFTSLPNLPPYLITLDCRFNPITSLPILPNSLVSLSSPTPCLPPLPPNLQYLSIGSLISGGLTCLPNYTNYITAANSNLPLCDPQNTLTIVVSTTCGGNVCFNPVFSSCMTSLNLDYIWNFGNGGSTVSNSLQGGASVCTTYSANGTYAVSLEILNLNTNTIVKDTIIYIAVTNVSNASITSTINCNKVVFLTNIAGCVTAAGNMTYSWNFGNGQTSTSPNPTVNYTSLGTYPVTLTVTGNGASVSTATNVNITSLSTANIQPTINCNKVFFSPILSGCILNTVGNPTANITYAWDFGNGLSSNVPYPTVSYAESGTYTVTLTATGNGVSVTKSVPLSVVKCN